MDVRGSQTQAAYNIACIPGDGIGPEVTTVARMVLDRAADLYGFRLLWNEFDWSCRRFHATGTMMPRDGVETLQAYDAIYLGAVGFPGVPDHISLWGLLIPIRRAFQQYVNLRPVRSYPQVPTPLARRISGGLDIVVVRENTEGEYSQIGGRHDVGQAGELVLQQSLFTRTGVERIVRYAFELAADRNGRICSATKSNGLVHSMPFWDEIYAEVAADYPHVSHEQMHVDALAARLVLAPEHFDVIVASNLFGDILSDLAAAVTGGLGLAPSANLNPERRHPSMFESVHGSAPDIAGRGIANPVAQILAGALMLEHMGERRAAVAVETAVDSALAQSAALTPDLGGSKTTAEVASLIRDCLPVPEDRPTP